MAGKRIENSEEKNDGLDDVRLEEAGLEDAPLAETGYEDVASLGREDAPSRGRSRSRRKSSGRKIKIVLVAMAVIVAAAGLYGGFRYIAGDPLLVLSSVRLEGGKYVSAAEIEDKFSQDKGRSVFQVPLELRRLEIQQIPWVRSATVRRVLPNEIRVTVLERSPVAFLARTDGLGLIDEEGIVLDLPHDANFRFPVARGIAEEDSAAARHGKMQLYAALMKDLERGGLQASDVISEVDLQDAQDARMVVSDSSGTVLLHLGKENFLGRYLIYLSHIEEWKKKFPNIESVDLRYEGQVVINADPQRNPARQEKKSSAAVKALAVTKAPAQKAAAPAKAGSTRQ
jgi:cell division protein FtsQ